MSNIQIEIPNDALARPAVARALAELILALGGQSSATAVSVPTQVAAPVATPSSYSAAPRPRVSAPKVEKPRRKQVRKGKTELSPALLSGTPEERWVRYVAGLPDNSRRFLALLEGQGRLTVSEAVEKLALPGPKAMGGLTGAMARWAPKQGVHIPYDAREDEKGVRYWIWTGHVG